ncbi:hypothetical protein TL5118_01648 [Thalassovita autumnalis]|uniref:Uncharacterized protein n=1 Tax=Thalassovita autumnalis TaxID=2072972 RepID=A0A0P1FDI3_9RHOB|nr:hypothetical protein TL5118_01648 [Thalassovita autumnalis]CUH72545.1 hypothetical protein TL5120_02350 [Thalassovita autumnalis]
MVQTDSFRILPHFSWPAIHALDTVLGYPRRGRIDA